MSGSFSFQHPSYRARCLRVVDGDTVDLQVDVGFMMTYTGRFRLGIVDTPELNSKDPAERELALKAKEQLAEWLKPGQTPTEWPLSVTTTKTDSFGRWLCLVMARDAEGKDLYVNQRLIDLGLAKYFKG